MHNGGDVDVVGTVKLRVILKFESKLVVVGSPVKGKYGRSSTLCTNFRHVCKGRNIDQFITHSV